MERNSSCGLGMTLPPCLRGSDAGQRQADGSQRDWKEGAADGEDQGCLGSALEEEGTEIYILSDQEGGSGEEEALDHLEFVLGERPLQASRAAEDNPRPAHQHHHRRHYECEACGRRFSDPSNLRRHRHIHTGRRPYPCETCGATFRQKSQLERHRLVHTGERPFQCAFCPKGFRDSTELRVHYRVHTGERPYRCAECQRTFSRVCYLKRHREKHRALPEPTSDLARVTPAPTAPPGGGFPCTFCSRSFGCKKQLELHRRGLHLRTGPSGQRLYECGDCRKLFNNSSNLRKHAVIHTGAKPFRCTVCGQRFRQATHLERHYLIHTGERPFPCPVCGKGFRDTSDLLKHQRVHTGEKPYQCPICQKRFKHLHNARVHHQRHAAASAAEGEAEEAAPAEPQGGTGEERRHAMETRPGEQHPAAIQVTGPRWPDSIHAAAGARCPDGYPGSGVQGTAPAPEATERLRCPAPPPRGKEEQPPSEPLRCNFCRKAFARISGLRRHALIHTGHRPFDCHLCGKTFRQLSHLERHKRIHTGERRYRCTTCQKAFRESSDLLRHQQVHTREKCFRCPLCLKTYTQLRYLKMHRLKHGLSPEEGEEEE
ncbi:zinc finger protein 497-like, partial [Rhinatrema bivittatum]|uniref:zinc finger protein 497-like n=1 Tax=Rhinatrema bivittatum TaxID=194408 RepID=UPI00112E1AD3